MKKKAIQKNPQDMNADELQAELRRLEPMIEERGAEWERKDAANHPQFLLDQITDGLERLNTRKAECLKKLAELENTSS